MTLTPLGSVIEIIMGQAPPSSECNFNGNGVPFVKVGEFGYNRPQIREWTTKPLRLSKKTDVLLCVVGATCGKINLGEECAIGRSVAALRPVPSKIDQFYLHYFMMTYVNILRSGSVGAAQTVISKDMICSVEIPLPPLAEQRRIVGILDEAFARLDAMRANAEKNLQNARALFESELNKIFGQESEGWVQKTLAEIAKEFGRGKSRHRPRGDPKLLGGAYPFIQTGDVANADHTIEGFTQTYNEIGLAQSKLWPKGTLCIAIVGANVAETAILGFDACFPDSVIGIVTNPQKADADYLQFMLTTYKKSLKEKGKGTARDNINVGTFEAQLFPFPAVIAQKEIASKSKALRAETISLEELYQRKLVAIDELKKSLLHNAFSGNL